LKKVRLAGDWNVFWFYSNSNTISNNNTNSNSSNSVQQPSTGDSPECCTKWAKQIRGKIILNASSAAEFESVLLNVNFFFFF